MSFKEGDYVLIVYEDRKYLRKLVKGMSLNVKEHTIQFQDIVGKGDGQKIGEFFVFSPTLEDIILLGFERKTQIVYPKDAFYIAFKLNIKSTDRVLEFGTGSGVMTVVLSLLAGEVWTYEADTKFYNNALKNWERFGLCSNVKAFNENFLSASVEDNFFDACFVDVREPWEYIEKVWKVLKEGKACAFVLPTTNQVSKLLSSMQNFFADIQVFEILLRHYKTNPERLRPQDQMVGHT
ncbi:MAG: tRNA (adenine-N1)-methyltransferase, partial [Hydrogenobacter sp.]